MAKKLRKFNLRKLTGLLAIILVAGILAAGTYALMLPFQHDSNEVGGRGASDTPEVLDVTLRDEFDPEYDWQQGSSLNKTVWVLNSGEETLYVRLSFKEFMEISDRNTTFETTYAKIVDNAMVACPIEEAALFATKTNAFDGTTAQKGDVFLVLRESDGYADDDDPADIIADFLGEFGFVATNVAWGTDFVSGVTGWYAQTNSTNRSDGIYGRWLTLEMNPTTTGAGVFTPVGCAKADCVGIDDHEDHSGNHSGHYYVASSECGECLYDPYVWSTTLTQWQVTELYRQYITWNYGTEGDEWIFAKNWDGVPVDKWIVDDESPEGWVYWGEPLISGAETIPFLQSIYLKAHPGFDFNYTIHVDMEACTKPWIDWPESAWSIIDNFEVEFASHARPALGTDIVQSWKTVNDGDEYDQEDMNSVYRVFRATVTPKDGVTAANKAIWTINAGGTGVTLSAVDEYGNLLAGNPAVDGARVVRMNFSGATAGTVTVTAKAKDDFNFSKSFTVEVDPILGTKLVVHNAPTVTVAGDTASWRAIAKYTDGGQDYFLIQRTAIISSTGYGIGSAPYSYLTSPKKTGVDNWYSDLAATSPTSKLVTCAVPSNALSRLGNTNSYIGEGFSRPDPAGQSGAFILSSNEAIKFASRWASVAYFPMPTSSIAYNTTSTNGGHWYASDAGAIANAPNSTSTNAMYLLRSTGSTNGDRNFSAVTWHTGSTTQIVSQSTVGQNSTWTSLRPALWVTADFFS